MEGYRRDHERDGGGMTGADDHHHGDTGGEVVPRILLFFDYT